MHSRSLLVAALALVGACGGSATRTADPEPAASDASAPPPDVTPAAQTASTSTPTEPAAPPSTPTSGKPASSSKIGGTSVSKVDIATVKAALEKAGYATIGPEEIVTCGDVETLQLSVTRKGKPVGLISLQRPAAKPDDCKATPVKEAYEKWKPSAEGAQAKNAVTFDEAAGVLLAINLLKDEPGAAKKLMAALVTK